MTRYIITIALILSEACTCATDFNSTDSHSVYRREAFTWRSNLYKSVSANAPPNVMKIYKLFADGIMHNYWRLHLDQNQHLLHNAIQIMYHSNNSALQHKMYENKNTFSNPFLRLFIMCRDPNLIRILWPIAEKANINSTYSRQQPLFQNTRFLIGKLIALSKRELSSTIIVTILKTLRASQQHIASIKYIPMRQDEKTVVVDLFELMLNFADVFRGQLDVNQMVEVVIEDIAVITSSELRLAAKTFDIIDSTFSDLTSQFFVERMHLLQKELAIGQTQVKLYRSEDLIHRLAKLNSNVTSIERIASESKRIVFKSGIRNQLRYLLSSCDLYLMKVQRVRKQLKMNHIESQLYYQLFEVIIRTVGSVCRFISRESWDNNLIEGIMNKFLGMWKLGSINEMSDTFDGCRDDLWIMFCSCYAMTQKAQALEPLGRLVLSP